MWTAKAPAFPNDFERQASEEDRTISQDDFALSQGLGGQSILCIWLKQKDKIMEAAADLKKKGLFRVSPVHKAVYNCMEYIRLKFCDDQVSTSLTKKLLLQILQHIYIYYYSNLSQVSLQLHILIFQAL